MWGGARMWRAHTYDSSHCIRAGGGGIGGGGRGSDGTGVQLRFLCNRRLRSLYEQVFCVDLTAHKC
jgi:hypothetical protein